MTESAELFVSYASRDRERVLPIVAWLEAAGVRVWIDREGISGGASYALEIAEAIEQAKAIVLMCSVASLTSRNVKQEIALGWRFEKPYLPVLLEPVEIPNDVAYWLEAAQWVEVGQRPASKWQPKLAEALARHGIHVREALVPSRVRPVLMGREREQTILRDQLTTMLGGQGSLVLIGGEAGIGKTTLVEDLTIEAEEQGCLVLWGHAYDLSVTPPYGPWLEIVRGYPREETLPPLPSFIGSPEAMAALGSSERLIAEVVGFFVAVARQRPLILVLDDLHWFDPASLELVRALARTLTSQRLVVLGTFRSDELHRHHPLYDLLPLFVRESQALRLDVGPLDARACRALVEERYHLPEADVERLAGYLASHAEGNPLYVGELLRTLEQSAVLQPSGEGWRLGDLAQVRVPPMLRQVIDARLKLLEPGTFELLQVGAVIGQEVPLELWQTVTRADESDLSRAIRQGRDIQLLDEVAVSNGEEGWRFRHALLREALYQDLVSLDRRSLHRQVAEALEQSPRPNADIIAFHYQSANDARAAQWLIRAGERAGRAYAWITAAERMQGALAWLERDPTQDRLRGWLLIHLGTMMTFNRRGESPAPTAEALAIGRRLGDRPMIAVALAVLGLVHAATGGSVATGIAEIEAAIEIERDFTTDEWAESYRFRCSSIDPPLHPLDLNDPRSREIAILVCQTDGELPFTLSWMTLRLKESVEVGERLLHRVDAIGDDDLLRQQPPLIVGPWIASMYGLAEAYALLGRTADAERLYDRILARYSTAESTALVVHIIESRLFLLHVAFHADDLVERRQLVDLLRQSVTRARGLWDDESVVWDVFADPLQLQLIEGRWATGRTLAERGSARRRQETLAILQTCDLALVGFALGQGDRELAWSLVHRYLPLGPETGPDDTYGSVGTRFARAAIRLCLDDGDLPAARVWFDAHDRWLATSGIVQFRSEGQLLWARYHELSGDLALARQHAEQALHDATEPRQPLALIAAHRFHGELDTTDGRFDTAEDHLRESLTLAEACQAPFERALTLLEIAKLRATQGRIDEAKTLVGEVRVVCEPLRAKPTLEHVATLEQQLVRTETADA
jgi:tetratricopeptide (TPR) repeat protein